MLIQALTTLVLIIRQSLWRQRLERCSRRKFTWIENRYIQYVLVSRGTMKEVPDFLRVVRSEAVLPTHFCTSLECIKLRLAVSEVEPLVVTASEYVEGV